jgi:predicted permease
MGPLIEDLHYALRALRKTPGFAVVSILTLALAIGVNTSIFSLVRVVAFSDLPMADGEDVVVVRSINPGLDIARTGVSAGDYLDLLERATRVTSFAALAGAGRVWTDGDHPERLQGLEVTAGLMASWRAPAFLGRTFVNGEDRPGGPPVAMLSHGFWRGRFAGRTDVIGRTLRLDGVEHTIIGVADPRIESAWFPGTRVITPLVLDRAAPERSARPLFVTGRLAPGVTHAAAEEEVRRIASELAAEHPVSNGGWGLSARPAEASLVDEDGRTVLILLQIAVGMVILVACANVATMLLARGTTRARELAIRSALGAPRGRLVRQLLTESLVISAAAAGLGFACARGINEAMIWISAGGESVFLLAKLDGRVLAFTVTVSLVATLVFGLMPAVRASSGRTDAALREGRPGDGGRGGKRTRSALVTAQVAFALTLMVVATLLTRTVIAIEARPLGFDAEGLLTASVTLPESDYGSGDQRRLFFAEARRALGPALTARRVELSDVIPGAESGAPRSFVMEGRELVEGGAAPTGFVVTVSPGYLDLIGVPLERGRALAVSDAAATTGVALVSRALADRHWPGEDPVGRRIRLSGEEDWIEIVGIAGNVRNSDADQEGSPDIYRPYDQNSVASMYFVARTPGDPKAFAGPIREAVRGVDPDLPVDAIRTMEQAQYDAEATGYALLTLFVTFAVFALLMAAVGIYGVMSYAVAQRTTEIGVRMALGAQQRAVRRMILGQGGRLVALGTALGLAAAYALSLLLDGVVYGISATDPLTFIGVPAILCGVALLANILPARKATRLDPARALRAG